MIFMLDAGMKSFPALRETSVSPVAGFTTSTPHSAPRKRGCESRESTSRSSASRGVSRARVGVVAVKGAHAARAIAATAGARRLRLIRRAERAVFGDFHSGHFGRRAEPLLDFLENES